MASFLLGVMTGILFEETMRYCGNKFKEWSEKKILDKAEEQGTNETKVLKDENNLSK